MRGLPPRGESEESLIPAQNIEQLPELEDALQAAIRHWPPGTKIDLKYRKMMKDKLIAVGQAAAEQTVRIMRRNLSLPLHAEKCTWNGANDFWACDVKCPEFNRMQRVAQDLEAQAKQAEKEARRGNNVH